MKLIIILSLSWLILSCATSVEKHAKHVRPWSDKLQSEEPYRYPFVASYRKDDVDLKYIAAKHTNSVDSPTFKTIQDVVSNFKPDLVILEPFEYAKGENPVFFKKHVDECSKDNFIKCGEAAFTVWVTEPLNTKFVGAEPTDLEILNQVISKSYSQEDLLGFYTVRQIPQWKRQGRIENNFKEQVNRYLKSKIKNMSLKTNFNYEKFVAWYSARAGNSFDHTRVIASDTAPRVSGKTTFLNKLSSIISMFRDNFTVSVIEQQIKEYSNVLVVYGGSHHATQKLALEQIMGPSRFEKLY